MNPVRSSQNNNFFRDGGNIKTSDGVNEKCSIIVSSCDNFSDLWDPFFKLFFKYWPDCPFKIYLISETKYYNHPKVSMISLGKDYEWASNLKIAIKQAGTPYFVYLQEDYLLQSKVDTQRILRLLDVVIKNNAAYLRLRPTPPPQNKFKDSKEVGEVVKGTRYSISNQAAIRDSRFFLNFLRDGETGWDTELKGSLRCVSESQPFLSVYKAALDYPRATAIKKGTWMYDAVKLCKKEGIAIDMKKRKIETAVHYYLRVTGLLSIIDRLNLRLFSK